MKSNAGTYQIAVGAGTLSANPATRGFGEADPTFTASFSGFRNGDTAAVLSGTPAFSTTATASSEPGTYPLTVAQGTLASPNYTLGGFTSSTLTITTGVANIATTKMQAGVLSATVTYGVANTPVVGSTITFLVGKSNNVACTAVTDATGRAECIATGLDRTQIQLNGYTARFPGTASLLPGEKHQGIL